MIFYIDHHLISDISIDDKSRNWKKRYDNLLSCI